MFNINVDLFFNAANACSAEITAVIAEFGVSSRIESHILSMKNNGKSFYDIDNDITVEKLEANLQKSLNRLKYRFFALNKASRKETGHYLFGKLEETESLANEMYEWLQNVI